MSGRLKMASIEKAQILQQQGQGLAQLELVAGGVGEEKRNSVFRLASKLSWAGAWVQPDAAAYPIQMG